MLKPNEANDSTARLLARAHLMWWSTNLEHHVDPQLIVLLCCRYGPTSCTSQHFPQASSSLARCTIINGTFISTLSPPLERLHLHPWVLPSQRRPP